MIFKNQCLFVKRSLQRALSLSDKLTSASKEVESAVVDQESRKKSPPNVENIFMVITRVAPHQTEIGKESEREKFNYLITFFRFRGDVCV